MPSILSHPAVPLAIGLGLGSRIIPPRLLLAGVAASIVPDIDVYIAPFSSAIQHRGITHTLVFALFGGFCALLISHWLHASRTATFAFVSLATLSHPLLDMCANGGSGILLLWPLTHERWFMPWTPVEVSPLGVARFFSERGAEVLASEAVWIWLPAVAVCALARALTTLSHSRGRGKRPPTTAHR